jgi:hypothetical protein
MQLVQILVCMCLVASAVALAVGGFVNWWVQSYRGHHTCNSHRYHLGDLLLQGERDDELHVLRAFSIPTGYS